MTGIRDRSHSEPQLIIRHPNATLGASLPAQNWRGQTALHFCYSFKYAELGDYLKSKGDMAIILVEQYFDFAYGLADQFYVLKRGAVALEGAKTALAKDTLRATVSV